METKILAHRGASAYRPENTLSAFKLAIEQNADGFELDVHLTKDGRIVVTHDLMLTRVSDGTGMVYEHTLEELRRFNFGKLFPEQLTCNIPTLAEVYELVADTRHIINVELKTVEHPYPALAEKLTRLTRKYNMEERVIYSSFNHYSLLEIKRAHPEARIGLLYDQPLADPWVYACYMRAEAIHPHCEIIAAWPDIVTQCHKNDVAVHVWTVDDPVMLDAMMTGDVDMIISNKPDMAAARRDAFL